MNTFFRKIFSSATGFLIAIHFIGAIISFVVLSYRHVADRGIMSLFSLEMNIPALKSLVWEVFLVSALAQTGGEQDIMNSLAQAPWWQAEYPALIEAVSGADSSHMSASYWTGPDGTSEVNLSLFQDKKHGIVLKMQLPKEAILSVDEKTGEMTPRETAPEMTIRDYEMDGYPDDFKIIPSFEPIAEEKQTEDGFTIYRNSPDHQAIKIQWSIGIGFCINHFLHGVDSAMPRD